jgi:DNA-binding CsgD family transcriptional regulator
LSVPYGDVLSLEFAVLDFSETPHDYAYRLREGDAWAELGPRRQVTFYGLAPGTYRFQVRGRDVFGLWGEAQPLPLKVVPPFWMTTTFRIMIAVLAVLLALGLHRLREKEIRRRAQEVQRLSEKREHALEVALGGEAELAVLTPRQKEVLQLVAEGYSTREVAELLGVSAKTVDNHRAHLMKRLDIHDVPGLVKLAIRARLVSPDE